LELNSDLAEELIHQGFESPDLDYKIEFDNSENAWMELAKDVFGMANYGGGHIVIGVEDGTFKPAGVDVTFHKDAQEWVDRISKWATGKISLLYLEYVTEVKGKQKKFPILQIHGSIGNLVIPKIDGVYVLPRGAKKCAFRQGVVYTRKNTSTVQVPGDEFRQLFWSLEKRTMAFTGSTYVPLEVLSALNKKAEPDIVEETLWFNLFPVTDIPDIIYAADTNYREAGEIYRKVNSEPVSKEQRIQIPPFLLEDKKIYSFSEFDEVNPLSMCVSSRPESIPTKSWLDDDKMHQKLVKLLNFNLKELIRRRGFYYDPRRDRFYVKYFGGTIPEITWKPYKSTSTRQLVYQRFSKTDGRLLYCEHFAGRLRFMILGDGIYLIIEPIRVLTTDGERPLDQNRNLRISTKKNFRYHNNNYLYDMKLWLHILARNRQEIHLGFGSGRITISILSMNSKVNFGILDDQHTSQDFLDSLKSEPLDYDIATYSEDEEGNPLTETSLED
jgi:hypothetical protein